MLGSQDLGRLLAKLYLGFLLCQPCQLFFNIKQAGQREQQLQAFIDHNAHRTASRSSVSSLSSAANNKCLQEVPQQQQQSAAVCS